MPILSKFPDMHVCPMIILNIALVDNSIAASCFYMMIEG
jgi:hypothetical protein